MKLYIIGKLTTNNRTIAYKVYDSDSKENKLIARKDIINAMKQNVQILGLRYRVDSKGCSCIMLNENIPNITKLNEVDSTGNSISNQPTYTLLGVKGFKEDREFHVIDANCTEYWFKLDEIKNKTIIGLLIQNSDIYIHSKYNKQIY